MALRNIFGKVSLETTQSVDQIELMNQILKELQLIRMHMEVLTEAGFTDEDVEDHGSY